MQNFVVNPFSSAVKNKDRRRDPVSVDLVPKKLVVHFSKRRLVISRFDPFNTTETDLWDFCSMYGKVEDVYIVEKRRNCPYAFVTFEYFNLFPPRREMYRNRLLLIATLHPYNFPNIRTNKMVANGIFTKLTEKRIKKYFTKYGKIEDVRKVQVDGVYRKCYITYANWRFVEHAIKTTAHLIDGHLVDIKKAVR